LFVQLKKFQISYAHIAVALVATAIILRLGLVLSHESHLGIDGGAYILSALDVLGRDSTHVGFSRPPLAPGWLLTPFLEALGPNLGFKLWTVLFSLPAMLPVYLLTREIAGKSAALFALAFFSVDIMQMEMFVTGVLPLIGFTLLGTALWAMLRLSNESPRSKRTYFLLTALLALCLGTLPYVNQTAAGIGIIVLPIAYFSLMYFKARARTQFKGMEVGDIFWGITPGAAIGAILALGAIPWYILNAPGNGELSFPGPLIHTVWITDPAIIQSIIAFGLAWLVFRDNPDYRVKTLANILVVLGVLILFLSRDEALINIFFRSRYFMGFIFYPALAWYLCRTWPLPKFEPVVHLSLAAVFCALLWGQVAVFNIQAGYKDMILPETAEALEIPRQENPQAAIITNYYSLSHWVAALNQVESHNTWNLEPSAFYTETDRHVRCLLGWVPGCDPSEAVKTLDAGYILIDDRFPDFVKLPNAYGAPQSDTWGQMDSVPWLTLEYSDNGVRLWRIDPDKFTGIQQ